MRALSVAILAMGSLLALTPLAGAQQQNPSSGLGGAVDTLNRVVNPDSARQQDRARDEDRIRQDERARLSSSPYARLSDQELRSEASRLQREGRALDDEMQHRNMRR